LKLKKTKTNAALVTYCDRTLTPECGGTETHSKLCQKLRRLAVSDTKERRPEHTVRVTALVHNLFWAYALPGQ
jgi:hypothetical protein